MPVHTEQRGDYWYVVDDKGKSHGRHKGKKAAVAHVTAMNIAMGYVPGVKPKRKQHG